MVNLVEKLEYFTIFHSLTMAQVHWKDSFSKWWKMVKTENLWTFYGESGWEIGKFHHDLRLPPHPISYLDYFYFRIYKLGKMGLFLRKKIEVN